MSSSASIYSCRQIFSSFTHSCLLLSVCLFVFSSPFTTTRIYSFCINGSFFYYYYYFYLFLSIFTFHCSHFPEASIYILSLSFARNGENKMSICCLSLEMNLKNVAISRNVTYFWVRLIKLLSKSHRIINFLAIFFCQPILAIKVSIYSIILNKNPFL